MPMDNEDKKAIPATAAAFTLAASLLGGIWYYATFKYDPVDPVADSHGADTVTLELPTESVEGFLAGEYDPTKFHAEVEQALDSSTSGGPAAPAPGH